MTRYNPDTKFRFNFQKEDKMNFNLKASFVARSLACFLTVLFLSVAGMPLKAQAEHEDDIPVTAGDFIVTEAKIKFDRKQFRDRFEIKGMLVLDEGSDGVDFLNEEVIVTLGGEFGEWSQTIPAGSFFRTRQWFKLINGASSGIQKIKVRSDGRLEIKARRIDLSDFAFNESLIVSLKVGDDVFEADFVVDGRGKFRGQKVSDDDTALFHEEGREDRRHGRHHDNMEFEPEGDDEDEDDHEDEDDDDEDEED